MTQSKKNNSRMAPPSRNSNNSISAKVLVALTEVHSSLGEVKKDLSDVKTQVAGAVTQVNVLQERQDNHRQYLEEKFRHVEQRLEIDARAIGSRLEQDRKSIEELTSTVSKVQGDVQALTSRLSTSNSQVSIADHETRLKSIEGELLQTKGSLKTLDWLWKAIGSVIITGIVIGAVYLIRATA